MGNIAKRLVAKMTHAERKQGFKALDIMEIKVFDKNGKLKDYRRVVDIMVNVGLAVVTALMVADVGGTAFDWIAIGTGVGAAAKTDEALGTETHRVAATGTQQTETTADDTAQFVATFSGFSGTEAITEAGVFNAVSGGVMLCRQKFDVLNVDWGNNDSVQITEKIVLADSG